MQYGCIAEHLGHSFSALIHRELASNPYELCEVAPEALDAFMRKADFRGINVTIPYKASVIPYLYWIDGQAKRIGAVNTVVNRDGKLYGYNTDFYGMTALLARAGIDPRGKKVAILGTGGTSHTATAVATALGAKSVLCVSRTAREGVITYAELTDRHSDAEIIINTTPVGMYPNADGIPVELSAFPHLLGVADAVYNPLRTNLILAAEKRGVPAIGGIYMLVAQAVRASEIFLDILYPEGTVERIYEKICRQKENVVLTGMPASGKSTVGALLAKSLGRELVDMDERIVKRAGKTIPEIFSEDGEARFRDLETEVLREELSGQNGLVIATGGGAILREENVDLLRRNGRLYFLDRPIEDLIPTADRPLASDAEAIRSRYRERYSRYRATCDVHVEVKEKDAEAVAEEIGKDYETK